MKPTATDGFSVFALALTRAAKDKSYTALDLTDTAAVDAFFAEHKVDSKEVLCRLTPSCHPLCGREEAGCRRGSGCGMCVLTGEPRGG